MRPFSVFAAAVCAVLSVSALAQNPPDGTPTRIRGTVEKLDGQSLTVKSRDGADLTVALAANASVVYLVKKPLSDIKAGDFVACTAIKGPDGKLNAVEVRIFPEALRGAGEGQRPWDLTPDSVMTNATVGTIAQSPTGEVLHVTYKGGEADLTVGPSTAILSYEPGDTGLLKPGAAVFIIALKKPDGTLSANRVTAEKDGIKPPM